MTACSAPSICLVSPASGASWKPPTRAPTGCTERPPSRLIRSIAEPLQTQAAAHLVRILLGHADDAVETEEIRCRQQVDVQGVALQPLAAIKQPAHIPHPVGRRHPEGVFERLRGAHLVGDRADATDTCHDIDHFLVTPPLEKFFEVARRLEDIQRQLFDLAGFDAKTQGALTLDSGQRRYVNPDTAFSHRRSLLDSGPCRPRERPGHGC